MPDGATLTKLDDLIDALREYVPQEVYTKEEAAQWLRCSVKTVQSHVDRGKLRAFKVDRGLRISYDALKDFVRLQEMERRRSDPHRDLSKI